MTDWRDARLDKALAHAPDADDAPAAATRAAIRQQALQAVRQQAAAPAAKRAVTALPWWRRWFAPASGGSGMPWNAAFASLLLAGVITLLWRDHEIPGARPDDPTIASSPAPTTATSPSAPQAPAGTIAPPVAAPNPAPAPAPARAPAPAAAPAPGSPQPSVDAARREQSPRSDAPLSRSRTPEATAGDAVPTQQLEPDKPAAPLRAPAQPAPPAAVARSAKTAPAPAESAVAERGTESAAGAARDSAKAADANVAAAPPAPAAAARSTQEGPASTPAQLAAPLPPRLAQQASPPPPSAPLAAAPAAAAAPRIGGALAGRAATERADARMSSESAQVLADWSEARVVLQDRTVLLPRAQAGNIAADIGAMALAATGQQALGEPIAVRIELRRDGHDLGVLELADTGVRWTLLQPGSVRVWTGRPDAAQLRALRLALERLN